LGRLAMTRLIGRFSLPITKNDMSKRDQGLVGGEPALCLGRVDRSPGGRPRWSVGFSHHFGGKKLRRTEEHQKGAYAETTAKKPLSMARSSLPRSRGGKESKGAMDVVRKGKEGQFMLRPPPSHSNVWATREDMTGKIRHPEYLFAHQPVGRPREFSEYGGGGEEKDGGRGDLLRLRSNSGRPRSPYPQREKWYPVSRAFPVLGRKR